MNEKLPQKKPKSSAAPGLHMDILSEKELEDLHGSTLDVLENTGLFIENDAALDCFERAGARVDRTSCIVKIAPRLVEEAIESAPSTVLLAGRDPKHDLVLGENRVHFTNFSEGVKINDPYNGENRSPVKKDLADVARVIDYLDEIDFCEKAIGAHDVAQESVPLHNAEAFLTNTTKHCAFGPGNGKLLVKILEMAALIVGGAKHLAERPIVSFTTCPVSPLKLIRECCEIIMASAKNNVVCNILSMAMAGATSPATLAGTLVTHNAEILGGITLSQLTRRGAPVIYGSSTTAMDLKLAEASVGTPECALISGAVARLARYYALPSYVAGGQGDGKISDSQMGHEKTLTGLIPALAGADMIYGPGMLESGITFDLAQLVLDCEFARMIKHTVNGISVNEETIALGVIQEIGPFGDFLAHTHTFEHMREQSRAEIIDRRMRSAWEMDGATDSYTRACHKVRNILENHFPEPLPSHVLAGIRRIVADAETEMGIASPAESL